LETIDHHRGHIKALHTLCDDAKVKVPPHLRTIKETPSAHEH
jgi:hypothetical protein